MFYEIYRDIDSLEKNIIHKLNFIDMKEYVIKALNDHYYTEKINGCYYAKVFFYNQNFSHSVKFYDFKIIEIIQLKIDYQFFNTDTKIDLVTSIETTDGDKFTLVLKCNYDFSVYDIEYWVD